MNRLFLTTLAVAAALTAAAAGDVSRIHGFKVDLEIEKTHRELPFGNVAPESRTIDLAGTYASGIRQVFTNKDMTESVGTISAAANNITVVADPETPGGYILKDFGKALFFNSANPGAVNDIKATFDSQTGVLSIAPGQALFARDFSGYGVRDLIVMTIDEETESFSTDVPVEFEYSLGCLNLKSPIIGFYAVVEDESSPTDYGLVGPNMIVDDMIAWIPNGEMSYVTLPGRFENSVPVFGVNHDGRCHIFNFANVDMFHAAEFEIRGNAVVSYGEEVAAAVTRYWPAQGMNLRDEYYLSAANVDDAYAPVGKGDHRYYLRGSVVADDAEEFAFELPACGLYNNEGSYWGVYDDVRSHRQYSRSHYVTGR